MPRLPLFAIVLAAGTGTRFGGRKQLAMLNGEPLVHRALNMAESLFAERTVLVVGDDWRAVHAACAPLAGYLIRNDEPAKGMAGSIAAGIGAVENAASAVMLLLADQPLIEAGQLQSLIDAWDHSPTRIVCTQHDGINGPPTIFPAAYFAELKSLRGDRGAKSLLRQHADKVVALACPAAGFDVDTPEDLYRAQAELDTENNRG